MRSQVHVVWLDAKRVSRKKTDLGGRAFEIRPLSRERAWERRRRRRSLCGETAGTSGFHEPCPSPQFVSRLVGKMVKTVGLDLVRALHGIVDFLQHDCLHRRMVRGLNNSATPSCRRGLFMKPASVDGWASTRSPCGTKSCVNAWKRCYF